MSAATLPPKRRSVPVAPYAQWIAKHFPTRGDAVAACASATAMMVKAFPELRRVRGYYSGREHWWCETADGDVVDPTAAQYDSDGEYAALDESKPHPTGYCANRCGGYAWNHASYCSDECEEMHYAEMEADAAQINLGSTRSAP